MKKSYRTVAMTTLALCLWGCSGAEPLNTVDQVDLDRFMGDWYVIGNIPTSIEERAHNAVESYQLDKDGTIATTFTFNDGDFDGELKTYKPRGFVSRESNAIWGMQFIWPIKADYRIIYLDEQYTTTVVGRQKRDYVWIMAREPRMPEQDYAMILNMLASVGYATDKIQKVPQKWSR